MTYLNTLFIFQLKVQSKRNEEELAKKAGILNQPLSLKGQNKSRKQLIHCYLRSNDDVEWR